SSERIASTWPSALRLSSIARRSAARRPLTTTVSSWVGLDCGESSPADSWAKASGGSTAHWQSTSALKSALRRKVRMFESLPRTIRCLSPSDPRQPVGRDYEQRFHNARKMEFLLQNGPGGG